MYVIIYFSRKNSALNSAANFKVLISPEFFFPGGMVFFAIYRLHENLRQKNMLHIME